MVLRNFIVLEGIDGAGTSTQLNFLKKMLPQALLISSSFQHLPCGEKSVAALEQKGLFHINLYYHCYD